MSNAVDHPSDATRVIAIVLTEREWRAFRAVEEQPVAWLQQKIRERLGASGPDEQAERSAPAA